MANEVLTSLFGLNSYDAARKYEAEQEARDLAFSQLDPKQQIVAMGARAGRQIGQGLEKMFGVLPPPLQRQRDIEDALREVQSSGIDFTDPTVMYPALAEALNNRGLSQEATLVTLEGQKAMADWQLKNAQLQVEGAKKKTESSPFGKINPKDYTAASLKKFAETGDFADLDAKDKFGQVDISLGDGQWQSYITVDGKVDTNQPIGQPFSKRPTASSIEVSAIAREANKEAGKIIGKNIAEVEGKYQAIDNLQNAIKMVDKGIYAGAYGPTGEFIAKYTAGTFGSKERLANTQQFRAYIGNVVIPRLQDFGGSDSNEELRYLQEVSAGKTDLEPEAIKKILKQAEEGIRRGIARLQEQQGAIKRGESPSVGPGPRREDGQPPKKATKRYDPATGKLEAIK